MAPKKKQEKMALGDFLADQSLGSWADEMDSVPVPSAPSGYGGARDRGDAPAERRAFTQPNWGDARSGSGMGGGMDRGMGGRGPSFDRPRFEREAVPFPTKPPYTAHLGNLAYDVSSVDVEGFLADCEVTTVRIMEDKVDRKPKGFGYVEFASADGLRNALAKTESNFMGRNVKISVADPPKDRPESNRDFSDWSRKGPLPDLPQQGRQPSSRGFNRGGGGFDNMSDAGSDRGGPAGRKPGFFENDGKVRDFGNWERKGPLSPVPGSGPPVRDGGRLREGGPPRGEGREGGASWGEGRSDAGSRPPRREFEPRPERAPTAAEQDNQWRSKMKPDASPAATPDVSTPTSPAQEAPKERPRLNLAKRTVSTVDPDSTTPQSADSKASPFGAARPIDTATREREVEEKRQIAVRQKKEADDKAREEKAAKDSAARDARAERADRGQAQQEGEKVTSPTGERPDRGNRRPSRQQNGAKGQAKENGEGQEKRGANFSILQREEDEAADMDTPDASANGTVIQDKETKPQEPVVPVDAAQNPEGTAEAMEDEGWSTVAAKPKNNRRAGGRAIAS